MVEFFDKMFHSEPPGRPKRGCERKSAAERGGKENRPVLMKKVGSISYYIEFFAISDDKNENRSPGMECQAND